MTQLFRKTQGLLMHRMLLLLVVFVSLGMAKCTGIIINDVSKLNPVKVDNIIKPRSILEIQSALKQSTGAISIGGGKFSMGGQTAFEESLHIDMRDFNKILTLDTQKKRVTVQAGITWRALQKSIDKKNLSIKIMQSYANFTVGGSVSVNCHGRYIGHGPIISSVHSMKVMLSSGEIRTVSRTQNYEIFKAVVGGYGGIAIIVEVSLDLVDNDKIERMATLVPVKEYQAFFMKNIRNNAAVILQNGDLYPPHYNEVRNVAWKKTSKALTKKERMTADDASYRLEHIAYPIVSKGDAGKWLRQKILDPLRFKKEMVIWRNKEASLDVKELEPSSREKKTYILQEYFIPIKHFDSFLPKMKAIFERYDVNVLNVSLRHAHPDKESYLSWAKEEVFAFVVYYKQKTTARAKAVVQVWTQEMCDAILSEGGTWYLPYQPHATLAQFRKAYPGYAGYWKIKQKVDPKLRLRNRLIEKYFVKPGSLKK